MSEKRVKLNQIVKNQLPSYVRDDFPLVGEFLSQYYTGQRVFEDKFPTEKIDKDRSSYLLIKNSDQDIIVALKDVNRDVVIQHAYIKARDNYKFKNIPLGKYVCMYMCMHGAFSNT